MTKTLTLLLVFLGLVNSQYLNGQTNSATKKNAVQQAHERIVNSEEYTLANNGIFKVKAYSIKTPIVNKTHHWFIKISTVDDQPVNYANVKLVGALKDNPAKKFNFLGPVFSMCSEGKYIIGFVNVKESGTWELEIEIEEFGKKDFLILEIEIMDV